MGQILRRFRPIVIATVLIALLLVGLEIGLRTRESFVAEAALESSAEHQKLIVPSVSRHHQLAACSEQILVNEAGEETAISINSWGLRGPEPLVPRESNVFRVIVLGDEMVFGQDVAWGQSLTQLLQRELQYGLQRNVEVINACQPESSPLLAYLHARQNLAALQADLVILAVSMDDVADDQNYRRLTRVAADGTPLLCTAVSLSPAKQPKKSRLDHFAIGRWLKEHTGLLADARKPIEDKADVRTESGQYAWLRDDPPDWSLYIEQTLWHIDLLGELVESWQAGFVVLAVPAPWQVSAKAGGESLRAAEGIPAGICYHSDMPAEVLGRHLAKTGFPFLDTTPDFREAANPQRFFTRNSLGMTAEGHALLAHGVGSFLLRHLKFNSATNGLRSDRRSLPAGRRLQNSSRIPPRN